MNSSDIVFSISMLSGLVILIAAGFLVVVFFNLLMRWINFPITTKKQLAELVNAAEQISAQLASIEAKIDDSNRKMIAPEDINPTTYNPSQS